MLVCAEDTYSNSGCQIESKHFLSIFLKTKTVKSVLPSKYIRVKSFVCFMAPEDRRQTCMAGVGSGESYNSPSNPLALNQGQCCIPQGHLTMSTDIFGCHK